MTSEPKERAKSNFANLSPELRIEIARRGGQNAHKLGKAHRFTSEEARAASQKGHATRALKKAPKQGVQS